MYPGLWGKDLYFDFPATPTSPLVRRASSEFEYRKTSMALLPNNITEFLQAMEHLLACLLGTASS